ncbi:MAG: ABC transporter ATP-binding protein/permease [Peptostreptococcaceae bacterium]|jgi:ATP-binding cassette subfamily B protein|nr:ABC transporter ATP-binding protein/permease [Peptostreptococcaceae bacterium]
MSNNLRFILDESGKDKIKIYMALILSIISSIFSFSPYIIAYSILLELFKPIVDYNYVKKIAFLGAFFIIIRFVTFALAGICSHIAAFNTLFNIRMKTVEHISRLNLGFFNKTTSGLIKKTINEDIEKIENFLAHQLPDLTSAIITPLLLIIYLMYINIKLSMVLLIPLLLCFLLQRKMFSDFSKRVETYHKTLENMNSSMVEFIKGMVVFKAFNMTAKNFKKLKISIDEYKDNWKAITKDQAPIYALFFIISDSALLFIIPIGGYIFLNGGINRAKLLLFAILSISFLNSLKQLLEFGSTFSMILEGVSRLRIILNKEILKDKDMIFKDSDVKKLEFKDVSFKYENDYVLKNINLEVKKGEKIAFVGKSGAGKTTAGQLIPRFFDVNEGQILINGYDIKDLNREFLMDLISFVFQENFLATDTIYNNLTMGKDIEEEKVIKACKKAQIHDFIMSLENGYKTKLNESGIKVSGGQKQRLSIARAILKDSPIIIMDEATSYSDIENERKIQIALDELLKDKTAIVIAHRLSTVKNANRIYVFDEGMIKEYGNHKDLINSGTNYKVMWDSYIKNDKKIV